MGARRMWIAMCLGAASCAWVTKDEYLAVYDADDDGFSFESDCAPDDPAIFPGAPDLRGDGCDADCNTAADADGDDWPNDADCNPTNPNIFPCNPAEAPADGVDSDCDGRDVARDLETEGPCPTGDPSHPDVEPPSLGLQCANPSADTGG